MNKDEYNLYMIFKVKEKYKDVLDNICSYDRIKNHEDSLLREENVDVLTRLMVEESVESIDFFTYKNMFEECVSRGFKTIYDIGSATGAQSIIIEEENLPLNYIAVEPRSPYQLHNFTTIRERYPFEIKADKTTVAISHLCIGITEISDSENNSAIKQLIKDFDYSMLHLNKNHNSSLLNSIPYEKVTNDIYLFDSSKTKTLINERKIKK